MKKVAGSKYLANWFVSSFSTALVKHGRQVKGFCHSLVKEREVSSRVGVKSSTIKNIINDSVIVPTCIQVCCLYSRAVSSLINYSS
jgi:hypothetical protein